MDFHAHPTSLVQTVFICLCPSISLMLTYFIIALCREKVCMNVINCLSYQETDCLINFISKGYTHNCKQVALRKERTRIWIFFFFEEKGKREYPGEKSLGARTRTSSKLNPYIIVYHIFTYSTHIIIITPSPGIEPGPHWWKASTLTTTPQISLAYTVVAIVETLRKFLHCYRKFFYYKERHSELRSEPGPFVCLSLSLTTTRPPQSATIPKH